MCREQQRQHQRAEQAGPALLEAENEEFEEPAARSRLDRHRLEPRADPVEARMGAARLRHGRRPARSATRREAAAPAPGWFLRGEIGRASCRERGCQYVWIEVVAVSLKKKKRNATKMKK